MLSLPIFIKTCHINQTPNDSETLLKQSSQLLCTQVKSNWQSLIMYNIKFNKSTFVHIKSTAIKLW